MVFGAKIRGLSQAQECAPTVVFTLFSTLSGSGGGLGAAPNQVSIVDIL
jgi:7-keto-8-aminopelargonate synthetase-like enzyme